MIRLSLAELQRIVTETNRAYAADAWSGARWEEAAERASTGALADVLRELHLGTWADTLERQTKVVTGD